MQNIRVVILFLLFALCISISHQCGYSSQQPILSNTRIMGGYTAREHSWPWIVSIRRRDMTDPDIAFCGGSLINEKYVLTAAHCFSNLNHTLLSNYFVVLGSHYLNDTHRIEMKIKSIQLHEKYDDNSYLNDIALVELSSKINLTNTNIRLICLPPMNTSMYPYEQTNGMIVGWGSLEENGTISNTLQQVQLPIISNKDQYCIQQISDNLTQFCAGFIQGGKDSCQGDSGGPLMIYDQYGDQTWHIAGIISYGYGCGREGYPGVYTRVSMFVDWVDEQINSSSIRKISLKILWLLFFIIMYFNQ